MTDDAPDIEGLVNYWRETYARRTQQVHLYEAALKTILTLIVTHDHLPAWQWRRRRNLRRAILETVEVTFDTQRYVNDTEAKP